MPSVRAEREGSAPERSQHGLPQQPLPRCPPENMALAYQCPKAHSKSRTSLEVTSSLTAEERTSTFTDPHNRLYTTRRTTTKDTFIL